MFLPYWPRKLGNWEIGGEHSLLAIKWTCVVKLSVRRKVVAIFFNVPGGSGGWLREHPIVECASRILQSATSRPTESHHVSLHAIPSSRVGCCKYRGFRCTFRCLTIDARHGGSPARGEWPTPGTVQAALLMTPRHRHLAELCSPLPLDFLPEWGSIPAAGQ